MQQYYVRYAILLAVSVICIDISIFLYQTPKSDTTKDNLSLVTEAIERPLEFNDVLKVNNIIDKIDEKIIIEKSGKVFTSNFGRDKEERNLFGSSELLVNKQFWKPLSIDDDGNNILYYKTRDINYFNKIISNSLFSLLLASFSLPLLFLFGKDINSLSKTIEQLTYYLDHSREQMEDLKQKYEEQYFEGSDKSKEKLQKKIDDFKNKKNQFKLDLEKKNEEIQALKENINLLKIDIQNSKIERNRIEETKNQISKEKIELSKKVSALENELRNKSKSFEERASDIHKVESEVNRMREIIKIKDNDISELKKSRISKDEFDELTNKISYLELDLINKNSENSELMSKVNELLSSIENQKNTISEINFDKVRLENEINNLKLKNATDREVIESLIEEKNSNLNEISDLTQKIRELREEPQRVDNTFIDQNEEFSKILLERDNMISRLIEEKNKKENELKEFTFDTLEKLSTLKRFEIQISDLSREIIQKNDLLDSLSTRIDVKDKIISSLNKELLELKNNFNIK